MRLRTGILLALILCCIPFTAYGAVSSKIVAVVNGEMISSLELEKKAAPVLLQNGIKNTPENASTVNEVNRQVLAQMIQEKLLLQAAAAQNISVPDDLVNAQLAQTIAASQLSESEYYKQAAKAGLTPSAIFEMTKNGIIIQQLITVNVSQKVVATKNEIETYYNEHKSAFGHSTNYHIALIIYPTEADAQNYSKQIQQGKISFADAAKKVSVGPNPTQGGDLGAMAADDMAPELLQAVESMKEGSISQLIPLAFNQAQVQLISKNEVKTSGELDAATSRRIEEIIVEPRLDARFNEYIDQLYKKAIIDIRY